MSSPPGALTESSPGQTDRVAEILSRIDAAQTQAVDDIGTTAAAAVLVHEADDLAVQTACGITVEQARELTEEIKVDQATLWDKVVRAYTERAWQVLGYESWDAYCATEFRSVRLRLPLEERQDIVSSLRDAGLSIRGVASAIGISDQTVQRDLNSSDVVNHYTSPDESDDAIDVSVVEAARDGKVTGTDGRAYPRYKPVAGPSRFGDFTSVLTPVRKALREVPAKVQRFGQLADDELFCAWFADKDSRVTDIRREITKAIAQLQKMDERVQHLAAELRNTHGQNT